MNMYSNNAEKQRAYRLRKKGIPYQVLGGLTVAQGEVGYIDYDSNTSNTRVTNSNGEALKVLKVAHQQMLDELMNVAYNRGNTKKALWRQAEFTLNTIHNDLESHYHAK